MKKIIYLVFSTIIISIYATSCVGPKGFIITNENDTLRGSLYVPDMKNPQKISIDPHYRNYTFKYDKVKLSDVKSVNFITKKNGIMVFVPADSINLWWVVKKEKNVGIYFTTWSVSYGPTVPSYRAIMLSSLNQKIDFSQVPMSGYVQDLILPKVKTFGLLRRQDLPLILNFINFRYKQNLSYTNFMNEKQEVIEQKMIDYILQKENERIQESSNK